MGQRTVFGWLVLEGPVMGACEALWVARWDDVMFHFTWTPQIFLIPLLFFLRLVCYSGAFVLQYSIEHLYDQVLTYGLYLQCGVFKKINK